MIMTTNAVVNTEKGSGHNTRQQQCVTLGVYIEVTGISNLSIIIGTIFHPSTSVRYIDIYMYMYECW